jgi:acetyl esterase/lipase
MRAKEPSDSLKPASTDVVTRPGARPLNLDLYHPTTPPLGAAVILLHGGGWMVGDRKDVAEYGHGLAAHGFLAIAAEYRLLPESPWPAQILDVKEVLGWAAEQAPALGVSPDKIALMGMSAGGHLALLAAGTQSRDLFGLPARNGGRVAAVVSAFAPTQLRLRRHDGRPSAVAGLLGADATEESVRAASPLTYVSSAFPPTFLLSGTRDRQVPHQEALAFFDALDAAGVPADLHLYHGHAHEFIRLPSMRDPVLAEVALFLKRAMVDPDGYAEENERLNPFSRPGFSPGP